MEVATAVLITLAAVFAAYIAACIIAATAATADTNTRLQNLERKLAVFAITSLILSVIDTVHNKRI